MTTAPIPRRGADGRYHYLYVTYDIETFEWYGGKHSTDNPQDGYRGSGLWIGNHLVPARLVTEWTDFFDREEDAYTAEAAWPSRPLVT